jgi:hypothetical protein
VNLDDFFKSLDRDKDGEISMQDIHESAIKMCWGWYEAPLFASLDLMSLWKPISREEFFDFLNLCSKDSMGVYGKALLKLPYYKSGFFSGDYVKKTISTHKKKKDSPKKIHSSEESDLSIEDQKRYREFLKNKTLPYRDVFSPENSFNDTSVLFIDPQRSFTRGAWMESIGRQGEIEVSPIRQAFENCANFLHMYYHKLEVMFTRCPFPPDSYSWDDVIANEISKNHPYFIKPGNSVLIPPSNGFREWVTSLLERGKKKLIIGGCTLTSCVRVSSVETYKAFSESGLQVIVDLNLSGARLSNYSISPLFDGLSPVEAAVREMCDVGIILIQSSVKD